MKRICNSIRLLFILVLICSMMLSFWGCADPSGSNHAGPAPTYADTKFKLSELTDDKLLDYLVEELGLEIPEGCDVPEDNIRMARHYVEQLEADPNGMNESSFIWTRMMFLRIKVVVSKYYGRDDIAAETQAILDGVAGNDSEEKDLQ